MNTTEVRALEDLLQHAMDSAVIKDRYGGSPIGTGAYLSLLASHRQSFDPDQRMLAARFQPEIIDDSVRARLHDVIRTALVEYIRNDMLQSAIIVTGGPMDGFSIGDLVRHLVTIAFCRGAQHAARSFHECVESTNVQMQFITLLDGIKIEHEIEISEGIRLVPIPNSAEEFPPYILTLSMGHYTDYYGRTLIMVDERVSPVFADPSEMSRKDRPSPFVRSNLSTDHSDFNVAKFCEALSLSINHAVHYTAWWTHVNPDDAYAVRTTGQSPAYSSAFHRKNRPAEVTAVDVQNAIALYTTQKNLDSKVTKKLRVPVERWLRSKTDSDPVDVFINLGTAIESLFLNDVGGDSGELRFRIALRAAWHLANDPTERSSLLGDFKDIYDRRSKAVHTGDLNEKERAPEFMAKAQELCLRSIVKVIEDGEFPDWGRLVVG